MTCLAADVPTPTLTLSLSSVAARQYVSWLRICGLQNVVVVSEMCTSRDSQSACVSNSVCCVSAFCE